MIRYTIIEEKRQKTPANKDFFQQPREKVTTHKKQVIEAGEASHMHE